MILSDNVAFTIKVDAREFGDEEQQDEAKLTADGMDVLINFLYNEGILNDEELRDIQEVLYWDGMRKEHLIVRMRAPEVERKAKEARA